MRENVLRIEGAKLIFRNFEGRQTSYNRAGERNFGLVLNDETARQLSDMGWNVRVLTPKNEDSDPINWLPVKVKFTNFPPKVFVVRANGLLQLDEDTVGQIDDMTLEHVDIVVRPYHYPAANGRPEGIAAYLKTLYVTPEDDGFGDRYGSMPIYK